MCHAQINKAVDIRPAAGQQLFLLFVRHFLFRHVSESPSSLVLYPAFMWVLLSRRYISPLRPISGQEF